MTKRNKKYVMRAIRPAAEAIKALPEADQRVAIAALDELFIQFRERAKAQVKP
jgi:hypothetical protein